MTGNSPSEQSLDQKIEEARFQEAWAKEIASLLDERRMAPAIYRADDILCPHGWRRPEHGGELCAECRDGKP